MTDPARTSRPAATRWRSVYAPLGHGCVALFLLPGCADFGTGGTGELVIPPGRLRQVETLELEAAGDEEAASLEDARPSPFAEMAELPLDIEEARALALEHNLGIRVDLLAPTVGRQQVVAARAAFESLFTLDAAFGRFDTPTASELDGSQFETLSVTPGVVIPLYTGGTITATLPLNRQETDNDFATLNPSYESDAALSIRQPLLRGAGVAANARSIRLAFYAFQQSLARTKLAIVRLVSDTDRAYWSLFAARELLGVRLAELELSQEQLARAKRRVAAGDVAEVEVLRSRASVAEAVEAIIVAENSVRDRQRVLKRLMNAPGLDLSGPTQLLTQTDPTATRYVADDEALAAEAVAGRMELVEAELAIAAEAANVAAAENGLLPVVTLDYTYQANGLGDGFDNSFRQLGDVDFEDHRVGLNVQVPIGNRLARAELRQALASKVQRLFEYEDRKLLIRQEVFDAADQLRSTWQRILAARQRVDLEARLYDAEVRQFEQGLRTSTDVRIVQNRLAAARASEIDAVASYQIARVDLAFATGRTLAATAIDWSPADVPEDAVEPAPNLTAGG